MEYMLCMAAVALNTVESAACIRDENYIAHACVCNLIELSTIALIRANNSNVYCHWTPTLARSDILWDRRIMLFMPVMEHPFVTDTNSILSPF